MSTEARKNKIGVLVMAYGTPKSPDEIEAYYTHIRRGRPPEQEQIDNLTQRYEAIGGLSPLLEITQSQVNGIENALNESDDPYTFQAYIGMKHAHPFIEDTVEKMVREGIHRAIGIVLAPHYSIMSVGGYIEQAKKAAEKHGLKDIQFVHSWHLQPDYMDCLTRRVKLSLESFSHTDPNRVKVLFTAHSLPEKILEMNDPYVDQLQETAKTIAGKAGITHWDFAWQSAGRTKMPWLGPDILEVIRNLHGQGESELLICPIGFVSDHLEILYDIDIECQKMAHRLGMKLERTPSLNDDPQFLQGLASVIRGEL